MLPVRVIAVDDEPGVLLLLCKILEDIEGALVIGTAINLGD